MEVITWFEASGSSPNKPYGVRRWRERRYVKVPGHLLPDSTDDQMSINTEHGETFDL